MSVSVGSQVAVDDVLFAEYSPNLAFLFPGQGAQAVGMGKEAQSVPAAAELYSKANEILGYDLLDVCINGPKEKLDSTVISQQVEPDANLYNAAIHGMCLRGKVQSAKKLYWRMRKMDLKPDGKTRAMMLQNLSKDLNSPT